MAELVSLPVQDIWLILKSMPHKSYHK